MSDGKEVAEWTPRVRRITAPNVGEKGKLAFIRSLIGERRFEEATEELGTLLETNPRSYLGNIQMGRLLERDGKYAEAVKHFEAARAANPTQIEAALLAGGGYVRLKDVVRAKQAFETALGLDSKRASAHFGLAQIHFSLDELDLAKSRLEQALTFDPHLQAARGLLARIHSRQGDDVASQAELEDLLSARPDQLRPAVALARLHIKRNESPEAIALLERATTYHEEDAELWTLLGRAKLSVADYKGAEAALRTSLSINPRQRELALHLVEAFVPQGKLAEARGILGKLPEVARSSARVLAAYGKIHMAAQQYKQAAESFRAALLRRRDDDAADGDLADGEAAVAVIMEELPHGAGADWQMIAERYESTLSGLRRPAAARSEKRRPRMPGRRKGAATAAAA